MSSAIWGRHFVRHLSWCLAQNISWEMYLLKNTRWHPKWANERSIFSPLSLIGPQSLQNKGSKLLDKYWMALPKGTMTSQLKNPAVKKIYIYLQQHINTVSLFSMYKFELSRFLKMWQELMNCSSKAVKRPFILIPMRLHCSVWKIHSNKITMRWYFDVRSTKPVSI